MLCALRRAARGSCMKNGLLYVRLMFVALILPLLAGCGGMAGLDSKKSVAVPEVVYVEPQPFARGWTLITLEDEHIALSIPPAWKELSLGKENLQSIINEMVAANPALGGAMSSQVSNMAAQGIKFFAFDVRSPSIQMGFVENVNLVRTERPSDLDLDTAVKQSIAELKEQLGSMLDGPVLPARLTTVAGNELARLNYDAVFNSPDGTALTISLVQYMAITDSDLYILTGTTPTARLDDYDMLFEQIAQSIYFLK